MKILCPTCLQSNHEQADFCTKCGAPLSPYATIDPVKYISTFGWLMKRVQKSRLQKIVLVGVWMIFLAMVFSVILTMAGSVKVGFPVPLLWAQIVLVILLGMMAVRVTRRYRAMPNEKSRHHVR